MVGEGRAQLTVQHQGIRKPPGSYFGHLNLEEPQVCSDFCWAMGNCLQRPVPQLGKAPFSALRIFQKMRFFLVTIQFYGQCLKIEVKKGDKRFHSEIRLEIYLRPPAGKICSKIAVIHHLALGTGLLVYCTGELIRSNSSSGYAPAMGGQVAGGQRVSKYTAVPGSDYFFV